MSHPQNPKETATFARTTIYGVLRHEVELRFVPNGDAVANFTLVVRRPGRGDTLTSKLDFLPCEAWGQVAQDAAKYMPTFDNDSSAIIEAEGHPIVREWEDRSTGQRANKIVFRITEFDITRPKPKIEEVDLPF